MKFTAELPAGVIDPPGEFQSLSAITTIAQALENAGIDACFITDHPAPDADWLHSIGHDALDPFAALAFVAAVSTKLLLHTNVVVLPYRNPFITAKAAATVHALSGGRLILGLGVGYQKSEFDALGADFQRRGALADEALATIRLAWTGEPVTLQGASFNAAGNQMRPAPNPAPPIWIGGASERALRRAAQWGDGWSPFYANPGMGKADQDTGIRSMQHLAALIDRLRELRQAAGQSGPFDIALGPRMRLKTPCAVTAQRFLDSLGELRAAGVNWATINIAHPNRSAYLELVQWISEEIISRAD